MKDSFLFLSSQARWGYFENKSQWKTLEQLHGKFQEIKTLENIHKHICIKPFSNKDIKKKSFMIHTYSYENVP